MGTIFFRVCRKESVSMLVAHTDQQQSREEYSRCRRCRLLPADREFIENPGYCPFSTMNWRSHTFLIRRLPFSPGMVGGVAAALSQSAKLSLRPVAESQGINFTESRTHTMAFPRSRESLRLPGVISDRYGR